jgi:hypothetical protein
LDILVTAKLNTLMDKAKSWIGLHTSQLDKVYLGRLQGLNYSVIQAASLDAAPAVVE